MTRSTPSTVPMPSNYKIADETQARIRAQMLHVQTLEPGSEAHRVAIKVLLLLQDSALALAEAQEAIRAARAAKDSSKT